MTTRRLPSVYVACVACGRLIVASKNGHPRRHTPKNRLTPDRRNLGTCDGVGMKGDKP